jgi:hypothetical protein
VTLVLSIFIGILVFVGGSAWAVAATQVLKDVKMKNHGALWIYAAVVTVVMIISGIVIAVVVQKLKINVPLDVTTVVVNPDVTNPAANRYRAPPRKQTSNMLEPITLTAQLPILVQAPLQGQ